MNQVTEGKIGDGIWHVARAFIKAPGFGPGKEVLFTSNKILKRPDGKALTGSFGHINVRPDDTEKGLIDMLARATGHKAKDIRLELVEGVMGPFESQVESAYLKESAVEDFLSFAKKQPHGPSNADQAEQQAKNYYSNNSKARKEFSDASSFGSAVRSAWSKSESMNETTVASNRLFVLRDELSRDDMRAAFMAGLQYGEVYWLDGSRPSSLGGYIGNYQGTYVQANGHSPNGKRYRNVPTRYFRDAVPSDFKESMTEAGDPVKRVADVIRKDGGNRLIGLEAKLRAALPDATDFYFSTDPPMPPMLTFKLSGKKIAVLNKKNVEDADATVGQIAIGTLGGNPISSGGKHGGTNYLG